MQYFHNSLLILRNHSLVHRIIPATILLFTLLLPAHAQSAKEIEDKEKLHQIIREYLVQNPEVVIEALQAFEEKRQQAALNGKRNFINQQSTRIFSQPFDGSYGASEEEAELTIVEFLDYQCGYCKQFHKILQKYVEENPKIRLVYKDYPVLGPLSNVAARAAIGAQKQGKFNGFNDALMNFRGRLDEKKIFEIALNENIDILQLKKDMQEETIGEYLQGNLAIGQQLEITGTPALIVGTEVSVGMLNEEQLAALVNKVRSDGI